LPGRRKDARTGVKLNIGAGGEWLRDERTLLRRARIR